MLLVLPVFYRAAHAVVPITAIEQEWSLFARDLEVCADRGVMYRGHINRMV